MSDHTPQLPLFTIAPDGACQELPQIVPITSKSIKDLTGQHFGRLLVLGYAGNRNKWKTTWLCRCECGAIFVTYGCSLVTGKTRSCGCLRREQLGDRRRSHGLTSTPEYISWQAMITRCENPNQPHYESYGGKGIAVCERWRHSFDNFLADMGPKPAPKYSIDRIDNELGYFLDNCRWATDIEQANNKSNNHHLELGGERLTISEWARKLGINERTLRARAQRGLSDEEVLTMAVKGR